MNMPPIDFDHACELCPDVCALHERDSHYSEYGINFFEFINTDDRVYGLLTAWWNTLPKERQHELIDNQILALNEQLAQLQKARFEVGLDQTK
jgi:hypothetical protein